MKRALRLSLALAAAGVALVAPAFAVEAPEPPAAHPPLEIAVRRQQSRQQKIDVQAFLDTLGLAKGSTVLDIGAGPGYTSFLFAERLQGSGEVFATEIRQDFVDHIAAEASRRGLANLTAALVSENGLDDFYARHRYDLVFLSNVYHALNERVDYFTRLRAFLKPGGRLVVILYNQTPLFSDDDFIRLDDLVKRLAQEPPESPFVAGLSTATRQLLEDPASAAALKSALARDFNRMLLDPRFYRHFYRGSFFVKDLFSPAERDLANWLLMTLAEGGVLDGTVDQQDERKLRPLVKLNRLFFVKRLGDYLAEGGRGAYFPVGDANRHTSKYVMLRELDAAGFQVLEERRLFPFFDAVIMAPKAP